VFFAPLLAQAGSGGGPATVFMALMKRSPIMVAINKTKGVPQTQSLALGDPNGSHKTQPGLVNMFFGDVMCPYCKKIYFTSILYDVTHGRKICKRIYEITRPVAIDPNRVNSNMTNKN
jgi:hypothetical protein